MSNYSSRTTNDTDDGYWAGSWSYNVSSDGIGRNALGGDVYSAFRFRSVNIPQGTTIVSATLTLTAAENSSKNITNRIKGIAEDNTADFSSDPGGRSKTTAYTNFNKNGSTLDATTVIDVTSIIQEIVNRAGWSSGNSLGLISQDQSSSNDNILRFYDRTGSTTKNALLDITWGGNSPSVSPSASQSPSASVSPSSSKSPSSSVSPSPSRSLSPSPPDDAFVLEIAKDGVDVLHTNSPRQLKFSSRYGTLKYFSKVNQILQVDGSTGDFAAKGTYNHNLGYKPYVEVFVRVYIGSPSGNYEYCPLFGSGASVAYNASYIVKDNTIDLYGEFIGVSSSVWNFDFLIFIYKNDLTL